MAAIDDLKQAVVDLTTSVTAGMAQIDSELQTILNNVNNDPAVEAAATSIESTVASLNADVAAAQAALGGPKSPSKPAVKV